MTYSPKGVWISRGLVIAIILALAAFVRIMHPDQIWRSLLTGAVIIVTFALAFRTFFCLDEIQRASRMRAWYYGTALGMLAVFITTIWLGFQPDLLDGQMDLILGHGTHRPFGYFRVGVMFTLLAQVAGNYVVRVVLRFRS